MSAQPLVIAHRGASAAAPENTIAAFERAIADGADAIELDVHLSRDDHPVFEEIRKSENRTVPGEDAYVERLLDIYRDVQARCGRRSPITTNRSGFRAVGAH